MLLFWQGTEFQNSESNYDENLVIISLPSNPGGESKSEELQMEDRGAWVMTFGTKLKSVHRIPLIQPVWCASGKSPDGRRQLKSELSLICNQGIHWLIAPIHQWNTFGLLKKMAKGAWWPKYSKQYKTGPVHAFCRGEAIIIYPVQSHWTHKLAVTHSCKRHHYIYMAEHLLWMTVSCSILDRAN